MSHNPADDRPLTENEYRNMALNDIDDVVTYLGEEVAQDMLTDLLNKALMLRQSGDAAQKLAFFEETFKMISPYIDDWAQEEACNAQRNYKFPVGAA